MLLKLDQLTVPPGSQLLLHNIDWSELEKILDELGENRSARLSYSKGTLEIMTPLPEHEAGKKIIGDLVSALLDELSINFWPLGSTTIKKQSMSAAVEPDECYYITNESMVRGRDRLDFEIDPPPDLAIEIDITSRTALDNYQLLGVPELWKYDGKRLRVYVLREDEYVQTLISNIFPDIDIVDIIPDLLSLSKREGRMAAIKQLKLLI